MLNAKRFRTIFAVALAASLIGCASRPEYMTAPRHLAPTKCPPGSCKIKVTVNNCNQPNGIKLDPEFPEVDEAVNMFWEIDPPSFVFEKYGILFVQPNAPPDEQQFETKNSPQPNKFHIHNKKTEAGDYYYFVLIKGCLPFDPWVRNN